MSSAVRPSATRPETTPLTGNVALRSLTTAALLVLTATLAFGQGMEVKQDADLKKAAQVFYAKAPMSFEPNRGQVPSADVEYLAHGGRYGVTLTAKEAVLTLDADAGDAKAARRMDQIHLALPGANLRPGVMPEEPLQGRVNYLVGNDPAKWHTDLPTYGRVRYTGVYPGVDLVYYGNQGRLEYDFLVAPKADASAIGLHFDGAKTMRVDGDGNLTIQAAHGAIVFQKPILYQEKDGRRERVEGSFEMHAANTVGFRIGAYDHSRALVIDPVLSYSSYLGGSTNDAVVAVAVDATGHLYATGTTYSLDFPTSGGSIQSRNAGAGVGLAFITKFNPSQGVGFNYSTYVGGTGSTGNSRGLAVTVDPSGLAYLAGTTTATDFPVSGTAFQRTNPEGTSGHSSGFLLKVNGSANGLPYSTYLGAINGAGETISGVAIDAAGDAVVVGSTASTTFPVTTGAFQATPPNPNLGPSTNTTTGFVASMNPAGSALNYSTFLGGSGKNTLTAVALDSAGNAYVVGSTAMATSSTDFPVTANAFQKTNNGTNGVTGTVTKLNPTGTALVYSTFLGTNGTTPTSVALDATGNAYVGGVDLTGGFPATTGAYLTTWKSGYGFVASVNAAGSGLNFGTFMAGQVNGLGVDSKGIIDVVGSTTSTTFPLSKNALQVTFPTVNGYYPATAAFLVRLNVGGASAAYSSYFSGSAYSAANALAIDTTDAIYIGGQTCANDFPVSKITSQSTKASPDCSASGGFSGFVSKFTLPTGLVPTVTKYAGPTGEVPANTAVTLYATTASSQSSGNVNFFEGDTALGAAPLTVGLGQAALPNQMFALGTHTLTANYVGDATFQESSSSAVTFTVISSFPVTSSPSSLTFGTTEVGRAGVVQNVQVTNTGSSAVTFKTIYMFGDFSEEDNCPISFQGAFAAGASCTIQVTFTPTATGTRTGRLEANFDFSSIPLTTTLTGVGSAATASLSQTSVALPDTTIGATSAPTTVTLTNTAAAGSLAINSIVASGDFAQTNNCGSSLAPGASCNINITFTPTAAGARTGSVVVTDNSSTGLTQTIALSGNGRAPLSVSTASLTFDAQVQATTSAAQPITLSNTGTTAIAISSIVASGDFAQTNNCGASLAANATCTVSVTFTPTVSSGTRTGAITITNSASATPQTVALTGTVAVPAVTLSPTTLSFAGQLTGTTSAAQSITLTNSGSTTLNVTSIVASGDFAQTNNCGATLAANASCAISVTFTPTTTGARTGAITVTDNASGSPHSVALSGTGTAPADTVSPTSLTFAAQVQNTTSTAQIVTLTNSGTATLTFSSIGVTGDFAATNTCASGVAAGASCTVAVTFTPTQTGPRTGTLTIADNATGSPRTVSLSGSGVTAVTTVTVSPTSLTFAQQNTNTTSTAQTVTLTNTGTTTLTVSSITTTGDYAQTNSCGTTLAATAKCTISVTFTPTANGTRTGTLSIGDNATGSPQQVSLTGTAITPAPIVSISPASLTFAVQNTATTSAAQILTVSNTGNAALTVSSIRATGDFAQTNTCGASVAANASCTISVTFTPTADGTRTGAVTITDNATGSPQSVALTGTGITPAPVVLLSSTSVPFGSQNVATTSSTRLVTLSNTGNAALTIASITASGDFAQTNNCGTTVAAGASCTISVSFTPTVASLRTGAVAIVDNAVTSPQTITLSGTGTIPPVTMVFSPTALNFGTLTTGSTSPVLSSVLHNGGATTVAISSIVATGDYTQTNDCPASLAANSSCTVSVTFKPNSTGTRVGQVAVTDNSTGSPQLLALAGIGRGISISSAAASTGLTMASAGGSATASIQLGSDTFSGIVFITCSVTYKGTGTVGSLPLCALTPPSQTLTAGTTPAPITLTLSTVAASAMATPGHAPWTTPAAATLATLLLMGWVSPKRRKGIRLMTLLLAVVLGGLAGCAGGGTSGVTVNGAGSTTKGPYNVVVTAANGGTAASITVPVTVN